uniref:Metalloendopeptidase n=1 Tax=Strongyloides papillosus TaxID=174720 RepID=A0A0N5BMK4_STREA
MNKNFLIFILAMLSIYKNLPELKPRFSNIIYYYIDNSTSYPREIESLLTEIQAQVCFKFVKNETMITGKGINFLSTTNDSDIELDNDLSKPTKIYIKVSDLKIFDQLTFFIGMALGLIPEITRHDRDKYVKVNLTNVKPSFMKYYKKESKEKNYFGSFDYGSIMAMDNLFGSKDNKTTYTFNFYMNYRSFYYNSLNGFFRRFTVNDYRRLNYMYCKNNCLNLLGCSNRGYPGKDCSYCICGPHFNYPSCQMNNAHTDPSCGIKTMYISYWRKSYLTRKNVTGMCYYRIKSSNGRNVAITIRSLELGYLGKLDIYYRSDRAATPLRLRHIDSSLKIPPLYKEVYLVFHDMYSPINFSIMYRNANYN